MKLMLAVESEETMAQIAQAFDGEELIEKTDERRPGVTERYEGFKTLLSISRENEDGVVTVTLGA